MIRRAYVLALGLVAALSLMAGAALAAPHTRLSLELHPGKGAYNPGESVTFVARLTRADNGAPIAGREVWFWRFTQTGRVNDLGFTKTDANGYAKVSGRIARGAPRYQADFTPYGTAFEGCQSRILAPRVNN